MTESKELVAVDSYSRASLTEKQQYVAAIARAGDLLPKALLGRPQKDANGRMVQVADVGKVLLLAETGAMLGLHPMAALQGVHIIDGKPSLSANLLSALVRRAGHKIRVTMKGEGDKLTAIAQLIRSDDPDFTFEVHWSHADAQKAGLLGKDNWKKYERSMLKARAITEVVREGAPDVTLVAAYTPEELGVAHTNEDGDPVVYEATREQPPQTEAPVVADDTKPEVDIEWWKREIGNASTRDEALNLFKKARAEAILDTPIELGTLSGELGQVIIEVGKALAEAEKAEEANTEGAPAVLDGDDPDVIVEAEIEEEEQ